MKNLQSEPNSVAWFVFTIFELLRKSLDLGIVQAENDMNVLVFFLCLGKHRISRPCILQDLHFKPLGDREVAWTHKPFHSINCPTSQHAFSFRRKSQERRSHFAFRASQCSRFPVGLLPPVRPSAIASLLCSAAGFRQEKCLHFSFAMRILLSFRIRTGRDIDRQGHSAGRLTAISYLTFKEELSDWIFVFAHHEPRRTGRNDSLCCKFRRVIEEGWQS